MTKKSTAKSKTTKPSRLGHDPLGSLNVKSDEDENNLPPNIEQDEQPMEIEPDSNRATLHLPSHFSISAVEEVYTQMSSFLEMTNTSIDVETIEVESIDTAALQLLYAFAEQTRMSGKNIHWCSRSEKIDEASRILNINIFSKNE